MPASRRHIHAIYAVFFLESLVLGNWIPRIPDIKATLELSDFDLGVTLLAIPMGTLVSFLIATRLLKRRGLKVGCQRWLPAWAMLLIPAAWMNTPMLFFAALLVAGFAIGIVEVAMNTKADIIEREAKTRIMSRCHGFWSLGSMTGAMLGATVAQLGLSTQWHFTLLLPVIAVLGFLAASRLPDDQPDQAVADSEQRDAVFRLPTREILLLCLMPVGIMMIEGAFIDWSAVFMRSVMDASPMVIGITYAFFSIVMAVTRLNGDAIAARFGDFSVIVFSGLAATSGIALFALAPNVTWAFFGAALAGVGVAIVYPLAMSAAARRPGNATDNVAALSMVSFCAFLLAPPVIGLVSDMLGLRVALLLLVPFALATPLLAREVNR